MLHNSTARETDMSFVVKRLESVADTQIIALSHLLIDCVEGGASVSFMSPLASKRHRPSGAGSRPATARGERALLVAEDAGGTIGTVQLILDLPENQPHRADLSKMLVHRRARRQGVGAAMLRAAEELARKLGKSLLVLDTASARGRAALCTAWLGTGRYVPDYALLPEGGLCDTTFFYRRLESEAIIRRYVK